MSDGKLTVKGQFGNEYVYTPGEGITCVDWSYVMRDGELATEDRPYPIELEEMPEGPREEMRRGIEQGRSDDNTSLGGEVQG